MKLFEKEFDKKIEECSLLGKYIELLVFPDIIYRTLGQHSKPQIISGREKTYLSFLGKIERKKIKNPLNEIEDFYGIRIVFLQDADVRKFSSLLEKDPRLHLCKTRDDHEEMIKNPELFGYQSVHYIISTIHEEKYQNRTIPTNAKCELQVRTIFQHIYAEFSHKLLYKREDQISSSIKRLVHSSKALTEATESILGLAEEAINKTLKIIYEIIDVTNMIFQEVTGTTPITVENITKKYYRDLEGLFDEQTYTDLKTFYNYQKNKNKLSRCFLDINHYIVKDSIVVLVIFLLENKKTDFESLWSNSFVGIEQIKTIIGIS